MKSSSKMIFVGFVCLVIGGLLGYNLSSKNSSNFKSLNSFVLKLSENKRDSTMKREEARDRILALRNDSKFQMLDSLSWKVEKRTLQSILRQVSLSGDSTDAIQFYPAIGADKGLTLVMVGRVKDMLVLEQLKLSPNGRPSPVDGEFWDFIGPCPPKANCPENEKSDFLK